jgi:ceramide glucosyltransferase
MEWVVVGVQTVMALLTLSGMAYGMIALWAVREFGRAGRAASGPDDSGPERPIFLPGVSVLKPVRGVDERMYAGFVSHCVQDYAGEFELLFGAGSAEDAAVAEVARLQVEFPEVAIRLVVCPERLGSNGKVSNLAQMLPHARFEHVVVNDSDIRVSARYLTRVMAGFGGGGEKRIPLGNEKQERKVEVGLVTAPYVGRAESGWWSRLEALGIATDFFAGVLTARWMEGGLRFGLGSTLATTRTALAAVGGFEALANELADDYELGARVCAAGYRVELVREVVETSVPAYTLRGFCEHQLRWSRSTRDSRRWGYLGLGVTYMLPWAMAGVIASGCSLWSLSLLSVALLVRVAVALTGGVGVLRDGQVLRDLWLLPLRDCLGLFFWAWSYASDVVVWRGERFRLRQGRMSRL